MSYIIKESFDYIVNEFLIEKQKPGDICHYIETWKGYVIQFESEYEKSEFEKYIVNKYDKTMYDQEIKNTSDILLSESIPSISSDSFKYYNRVYKDAQVLMREYKNWKNNL